MTRTLLGIYQQVQVIVVPQDNKESLVLLVAYCMLFVCFFHYFWDFDAVGLTMLGVFLTSGQSRGLYRLSALNVHYKIWHCRLELITLEAFSSSTVLCFWMKLVGVKCRNIAKNIWCSSNRYHGLVARIRSKVLSRVI